MVRWRCASALCPSPSRLPPGADNKAQKAKKGEEKRAEGYPAGTRLKLVERHGHPAAIARHEDGDEAAILPIEEAHGAWRLRLCPPRLRRCAKDNRLRENVNALYASGASRGDDGPGRRVPPSAFASRRLSKPGEMPRAPPRARGTRACRVRIIG